MIILKWTQLPEADVASYNVYRSIIGFCSPVVPLATLDGTTLELKLNGGPLLTVTFDDTTPIVDAINAVIEGNGGKAYLNADGLGFCVRSDIRCGPDGSVEIVGGTSLGDLGQTARVITDRSEDELIGSVTAPSDPLCPVEFIDPDGVLGDYYALTTLNSSAQESLKTEYVQPVQTSGPLCIIEGVVVDLQGVRQPDVTIQAKIIIPPECTTAVNTITTDMISVLTDSCGRFRLALLQDTLVEFTIPSLDVSRNIRVPNKSFVFINDLIEDLDYRFPLFKPMSSLSTGPKVITSGGDDT